MYLDYTPAQRELREELRAYFTRLMTPDLQAELSWKEGGGPLYREALRQMGRDGWLGIGWPQEYGGQGRSPLEQFIFSDEVQRAGFPLPFLTLNTVGPTIMEYGTPEQKHFFLPRILAGECHFSIGYSEPGAGTDLASLRTRAVRDGDDYVVTGNKVFTSLAEYADYIWLAVRTDPTAAKHKGISMLIVNTRLPGYKCTPIWTMAGVRTNATYYEDVRVPTSSLVGRENEGWWLITSQLNRERIALSPVGPLERMLGDVRRWAEETRLGDGRHGIDQEWVRVKLARVRARWEALKLLVWRQAWCMTQGSLNFADASAVKVYASEFYIEAYRDLMEVVGQRGYLKDGSPEAVLGGRLEFIYRASLILTFGGGTNEIQRDIIAMAGLKMPRSLR
ncbi:MAG TPA: acyl-CoA dehydrogenase family protein [Candidatus Nitrosopolaris sp.]|nr:acyl-CoA dehydrogenase family protein [Candidatus Nitrosopolaris sp.]